MPDETQMETENQTPSTTRERARIYVTGDCDGLPDLREALGAPEGTPMLYTDARNRNATKQALITVVRHAMDRLSR